VPFRAAAVALVAIVAALAPLAAAAGNEGAAAFRLTSPSFAAGGRIPVVFTCRGRNVSPALRWTAPPARARSLALHMHDPDAPIAGGFNHWIGWGIAAGAGGVAQGARLPIEGANGTGAIGYLGPCPPSGVHRYRFTLYALDAPLALRRGASLTAFEAALRGHVVARAQLIGRFGS
jgi:Raf kinase inhibitor-like YbhB/YbcL family protein